MLAIYKGSAAFVLSQDALLGQARSGRAAAQNARVKHFMAELSHVAQDLSDSVALMDELQKETLKSNEKHYNQHP